MLGIGITMLFLSFELGFFSLLPAFGIVIVTRFVSPWVKRKNLGSLKSLGDISSDIQQSLSHFKVIVAFHRLDYFRKKFLESNEMNFSASVASGLASNVFLPLYGFASNLAQLVALCFGLYLVSQGDLTIGMLIGFQIYVVNFYSPLRQIASMWSSFQLALASLDRISEVLKMESDMIRLEPSEVASLRDPVPVMEFKDVSFHYPDGKNVLNGIDFSLEKGKTYALVGPT
jgi:ATP-binding cassette subfamily B protein